MEQRLLSAALGTLNCESICVNSSRAALDEIERSDFDLAVISSQLPDAAAAEAIQAIRRREDWKGKVPILLIFPDQSASQGLATALGADAYLSKPLQMSQFLAAVLRLAAAGQQIWEQSRTGWSVLECPVRGVEDLRAPAVGANFDVTQWRPGLKSGHVTYAFLGESVFSFGTWESSTAIRLRGDLFKGAVYFSTGIGPAKSETFWGKDVAFGDSGVVLAAGDGHEFDSVLNPGTVRYAAMAVPEALFYEFAQTLFPNVRRIRSAIVFQPARSTRLATTKAIHRAVRIVRSLRQSAAPNFDSSTLSLSILAPLMAGLDVEEAVRPMRGDRSIISRVEELARSEDIKRTVPPLPPTRGIGAPGCIGIPAGAGYKPGALSHDVQALPRARRPQPRRRQRRPDCCQARLSRVRPFCRPLQAYVRGISVGDTRSAHKS